MSKTHQSLRRGNCSGQALSEYLILTLLIAVTSIVMVRGVGHTIYTKMHEIQQELEHVTLGSAQGKGPSILGGP